MVKAGILLALRTCAGKLSGQDTVVSYPLISVFCVVDFLIRQLKINLKGEWL